MPTKIASKEEIAGQGFGVTGVLNGERLQKYWTPDGREFKAAPSMHEYVKRDKGGKAIENGVRDANLDKGWLTQPPQNPKLKCDHCDKWHDTEEETKKCGVKRGTFNTKYMKKAKKEIQSDDRVDQLESDMSEIKGMLKQLLEAK